MEYNIEKDISIPAAKGGGYGKSKFRITLESMTVGESLLVHGKDAKASGSMLNSITQVQGKKYIRRSLPEGMRIWRTE